MQDPSFRPDAAGLRYLDPCSPDSTTLGPARSQTLPDPQSTQA